MDSREPQRFRRIDVPDAGDNPLIEKRDLDRDTSPRERVAERFGGESRVRWIWPQRRERLCALAVQRDRRQRARIDQRDASTIVELDHHASVLREGSRNVIHEPVSRHSKVNDERVASRKREQLVLAATIHARYTCPSKTCDCTRRKMSTLRTVQSAYIPHSLSDCRVPQNAGGIIDLW